MRAIRTSKQDRAVVRPRIVHAVLQLVAQRGLAVTLNEIAREVGLGGGGLDHLRRDANGIVEALFGESLDDPLWMIAGVGPYGADATEITAAIVGHPAREGLAAPEPAPLELAEFRTIVTSLLTERKLTLGVVARRFAVSQRTLQRRLAQFGTNWRAEVDGARRREAFELVRAGASKETIAARLGYSDTRALRRALARWETQRLSLSNQAECHRGRPPGSGA